MSRNFLRRYLPDRTWIRSQRSLQYALGDLVHDANLWHLNRRSVSGGIAIGVFIAWIPLPVQMVSAGLLALLFRVNLPLAVVFVWVSNPFTMGPMYWGGYRLGVFLLDKQPQRLPFEPSLGWVVGEFHRIWEPLFLGSLLLGALSAGLAYLLTRVIWRWQVVRALRSRPRAGRFSRNGDDPR